MGDKVEFLLADKRKGFLQVESITLRVHSQACSKYPREVSLEYLKVSLEYLQKNVGDEVDFLLSDKHQIFLQVDSITLGVRRQTCSKHLK